MATRRSRDLLWYMHYEDSVTFGHYEGYGQLHPLVLSADERMQHVWVVGQTGTGKSTLLKNIAIQDIHAGRGCGLIDLHGDLARDILNYIPQRRIEDVVYFDAGDAKYPFAWNLLHTDNPEEKDIVVSGIVSAFRSVWRDSWGQNLDYYLTSALKTLLEAGGEPFLGISRLFSDAAYRERILRRVDDPFLHHFWAKEFGKRAPKNQAEVIAPVLNRIGKLGVNPLVRNIFGQTHSKVSAETIMTKGYIFIANLSKGSVGEDNASLMGAMLLSQFYLTAMRRRKLPKNQRRPFFLSIDEFQNIGSDNFASILSEVRKYNLSMTLAHQYMAQLREVVMDAIGGNVGSMLALRVGESDAATLARQFGNTFLPETFTMRKNLEVCAKLVSDKMYRDPVIGMLYSFDALEQFHRGHRERIINRSRRRFARRQGAVSAVLEQWMRLNR